MLPPELQLPPPRDPRVLRSLSTARRKPRTLKGAVLLCLGLLGLLGLREWGNASKIERAGMPSFSRNEWTQMLLGGLVVGLCMLAVLIGIVVVARRCERRRREAIFRDGIATLGRILPSSEADDPRVRQRDPARVAIVFDDKGGQPHVGYCFLAARIARSLTTGQPVPVVYLLATPERFAVHTAESGLVLGHGPPPRLKQPSPPG